MLYISIFITFPNQQYVKRCSTVAPKMHNLLTGVVLILFPQCYLKSACSTTCSTDNTLCATCTKIVAFTGITIHRHPCSTALRVFINGAGQRPAPYPSGGSARQTIPVPRSNDRGTLRKYRKYVIISVQHPISCHL